MTSSRGILVAALLLLAPAPSVAGTIIEWTGTCEAGCVGQASFHLELTGPVVPGDITTLFNVGRTDILVARYTDSETTVNFVPAWLDATLRVPVDPTGAGFLRSDAQFLRSDATGHWLLTGEFPVRPGCGGDPRFFSCNERAEGSQSVWTRVVVPWPPGAVLLALGLLLLYMHAHGVARARRRLHDHGIEARLQ